MPSCNGWEPSGQIARKSPACSAANSSKRWRKLPGKVWTSEVVAASVSMMFRCVWVCSFHPRNNLPNHHGVAPNWMWWASPVKNTTKVTITAFVCLWKFQKLQIDDLLQAGLVFLLAHPRWHHVILHKVTSQILRANAELRNWRRHGLLGPLST